VIDLRRREGRLLRIGHRGAAALAPENTIASLRAAVELGVDLLEFDVLDLPDGTLILAHSRVDSRPTQEVPTLEEALRFFAEEATGTGLHVDLKPHGHESALVDALRRNGVVERSFVSSFDARSLRELAVLEPGLRLGLTYPRDRHGVSSRRLLGPLVGTALGVLRRLLPRRIERLLRRADASVAVLHWSVVSRAVVERCHASGAAVLAWTVNEQELVARLDGIGVDGVVTDDPRVFGARLGS
jgi:glycerophosphoryl diester phosphodiesterase